MPSRTLADLGTRDGDRPVLTVVHRGAALTASLLSLPPGVEMTEHAAPRDASVFAVEGEATVAFMDGETVDLHPGIAADLAAHRRHRVVPGPDGATLLLVVSRCATS